MKDGFKRTIILSRTGLKHYLNFGHFFCVKEATMYLYKFSGIISVFVGFLSCVIAQNCDFNECSWTFRNGFIQTNYSLLRNEGLDVPEFNEKLEYFGFCANTNNSNCRIRSPWLIPDTKSKSVCLFLDVFAGRSRGDNPSTRDKGVEGLLKISLTTEDREIENKLQNLTHLHQKRWQTLSTKFSPPDKKYRLIVDINLGDNEGFVAVDAIKLVFNCADNANVSQVNKTHRCFAAESFMCDGLHCIGTDKMCNLNQDCDNGKDETDNLCDELPDHAKCNFEKGSCGWQVFKYGAPLNWTRHNGETPTSGTGPPSDHTLGNSAGYYMYLESSDGRNFKDAVLTSRVFKGSDVFPNCKVRFFYHMYGRRIGHLSVEVINWCQPSSNPAALPEDLWKIENDQGNAWKYQEVDIPLGYKRFAVQFRAHKTIQDHGDIAIDDVSFTPECFGYRYTNNKLVRQVGIKNPLRLGMFIKKRSSLCQNTRTTPSTMVKPAPRVEITSVVKWNSTYLTSSPKSAVYQTVSTPENETSPNADPVQLEDSKLPLGYIIVIIIAAIIVTILMGTTIICIALRSKKNDHVQNGHLEIMSDNPDDVILPPQVTPSSFDMQLRCTVTELNPNYDFINAKYPEHQLREIPRHKLKLTRLIGQGAFGEVYEGTLKNLCANVDQLQVAVKTLPALCSEQAETDFTMEAIIISKFMHKNVVKCLGVCFEDHPRYIILELLQGGDLRSFLRDCRPKDEHSMCVLNMEDLVKLALDVANGCRHLEEKRFIHRDIAARNCLLTSRGSDRIAKIADFGMSRDIYSADYYRKGGKTLLPIKWMPPEAFLDGVFTTKTDVWSFGILLWEIFTLGYMPYPGQTNTDVMHFVASGGRLDPPDNCPARLNKIMIMCWNSVADIRPSFSEIIEHLDMCLQDPEVMNADLSLCHQQIGEYFKDAATLAKTDNSSGMENTIPSPSLDMQDISAEFRGTVESQSTEPLLQP